MRARREPSPWGRLLWPAVLLVGVLTFGIGGYMLVEGWSFLDALYMTVTVLSTVGFREVRPLDLSGKVLTISLILAGVTLLIVTLSLAAGAISDGALGERSRRRRMQKKADGLRNHFIVCAYGRVGHTVVREFGTKGIPLVVIESDENLEDELIADGLTYLIGDPTRESVLAAAGIERARGLICAVDSDATNVYITLTARSMNPDIFVIARASEAGAAEQLQRAGADRVLSPYVTSGRQMAFFATRPKVVDYMEVRAPDAPPLRIEELLVGEGSDLVGSTVAEASEKDVPLALRRASGELIAHPPLDERLGPGDVLVILDEETVTRIGREES